MEEIFNKYELAFYRIDSTIEVGLPKAIFDEFGVHKLNEESLQKDMATIHELVKLATPMKVEKTIDDFDEWFGDVYICQNCKRRCIWSTSNYCMNCGQAIGRSDK